jgi:CRP/FNR family transcriptional regulator, anaerobic regulatory protein
MNADLCLTCPNRDRGFCGAAKGAPNGFDRSGLSNHFRVARKGQIVSVMRPRSDEVMVICEGWAFEHLHLSQGRWQILAFLSAGDLLFPGGILKNQAGTSARALTDIQVGIFSKAAVRTRIAQEPQLAVEISTILAERLGESTRLLTAIARSSAEERIAWFLLHLTSRLRKRSPDQQERYSFPFLQQHIADSIGLTPVHVSRTMASFRARGWLRLEAGLLEISNRIEMEKISHFNSQIGLT